MINDISELETDMMREHQQLKFILRNVAYNGADLSDKALNGIIIQIMNLLK